MKIITTPDRIVASLSYSIIDWTKGTHTANVFENGLEVDVFTFGWEKDKPSMLDFTLALQGYIEYLNEELRLAY